MLRNSYATPARKYAKGIGDAVADRTINRKKENGKIETWADVAYRVAAGNVLLVKDNGEIPFNDLEFHSLHHHLRQGSVLMSGRHLQHGDDNQPSRPQEVFTNCSTSASTFLTFYLLLNGSGVGRCFDDDMMLVNMSNMPIVIPVINSHHHDVQSGEINTLDYGSASHLYANRKVHHFLVPDSREGWAKALEIVEVMTFEGTHREEVLLLDFSNVRHRGTPINGMQGRPASGPGPLMAAISNIARLRDAGMEPWRAAMYADHYASECVLVGGARRAARMATKTWHDESVLEFIKIKQGGFLWSANNSVTVDQEFWNLVKVPVKKSSRKSVHAHKVFEAICSHAYHDKTGEPGIINVDRLSWSEEGIDQVYVSEFAHSSRYQLDDGARAYMKQTMERWAKKKYKVITNPCGEIVLNALGGYCVIADVVPFHASDDDDAESAFRTAVRALMRVNKMESLYSTEVKRTNRIGVGFTGIHEYAWSRFSLGFRDLIDENKSQSFWQMLARFRRAVDEEAQKYAADLGVRVPHTVSTVKPAGTTSKLFGLTEGAHLPSMREYLRWVQFRSDDSLVETYRSSGYPVKKLVTYSGTIIVGFPTQPMICSIGMGDKLLTASEATPEEQYQWLRLIEKYWIRGVKEDGVTPLEIDRGNQVSYTLKYNPAKVSYEDFKRTLLEGQSTIRCCAVMPMTDTSAYEYTPEQAINKHEYELIAQGIAEEMVSEDAGAEHLSCENGACPVDFRERKVA